MCIVSLLGEGPRLLAPVFYYVVVIGGFAVLLILHNCAYPVWDTGAASAAFYGVDGAGLLSLALRSRCVFPTWVGRPFLTLFTGRCPFDNSPLFQTCMGSASGFRWLR